MTISPGHTFRKDSASIYYKTLSAILEALNEDEPSDPWTRLYRIHSMAAMGMSGDSRAITRFTSGNQ